MLAPVNWLAVIAAAAASMIIGTLWYGPLFGRVWMRLRGKDPAAMDGMKFPADRFAYASVASLVTAYILAQFLSWVLVLGIAGALVLAFWLWLGFYATTLVSGVLWEGQSWELYFFNAAFRLINLLVMAAILEAWK